MCVRVLYICALLLCVGAHTSKRVGVVVAVAEARKVSERLEVSEGRGLCVGAFYIRVLLLEY